MNFTEILIAGMSLAIGLLLIVIALLCFVKKRYIELGLIAFILSTSTLHNTYNTFSSKVLFINPIIELLIADYREILIIPLLYIYLRRKLEKSDYKQLYIQHFTFPFVLIVAYLVYKYYTLYQDRYSSEGLALFILMRLTPLLLFIFYYVKGILLLKKHKENIIASAYRRYSIFYHIQCVYYIYIVLYLSFFFFKPKGNFNYLVLTSEILDFLVISVTLFFMMFEIDFFKKLFLKKSIKIDTLEIKSTTKFDSFISQLKNEELFVNENFDLRALLKENNITSNDFKTYILNKYNVSVTHYLNELRVAKFIDLYNQSDMVIYDMSSLSKLAGFNSKATFYRVFKSIKGVSPKQYFTNSD